MIKFSKAEMKNGAKVIRKNIKKGGGRPKKIKMEDTTGDKHKLKLKQYLGLFKQWNIFRLNNGRFPNYVTYIGKAKEPTVINYQDNGYQCACASFNMALQSLFDWEDESTIAKAFNTGRYGTGPSDMINGAKKFGYIVEPIGRNKKSLQKAFDKGYGVIAHIDTIKAPCLGYRNNYGHYINIQRITKAGNYRVFDPTKGVISAKPSCIDNAMLDRTINYYQVRL